MSDRRRDDDDNLLALLREGAEHELDELVDFELDVEELAEDEWQLLASYVRDDISQARRFWRELKEELALLETRLGLRLLSIADPTAMAWLKLRLRLDAGPERLLAGDTVSGQVVTCLACGHRESHLSRATLDKCPRCGGEVFSGRPLSAAERDGD